MSAVSRHVTKPPFSLLIKPLLESLFTEQDLNAQIGSAMCVSAAIENSPHPDPIQLTKLLPRLEKLLKCESYKAKSVLLGVFGSVIGVRLGLTQVGLQNLVTCHVECLGSEDWAVRKAAAEVLVKVAIVERERLLEYKAVCLKSIEAKRFDKVKIVRETMNQLVEAWKEIPDVSSRVSHPMETVSSSIDDASDGRYPPGSRNTYTVTPVKKITPSITTTGHKRTPLDSTDKRSGPAMFRKLDRKKPTDQKIKFSTPSRSVADVDSPMKKDIEKDENVPSRFAKLGARRALFSQNNEYSEATVVVSNATEDINRSQKECEDLSLIYKQLGQIESQQANLLDLLQKFIGSSQTGLRALETRVHGLELTLDEISHDLSLSKKMPNSDERTSCCMLPGTEFLSPKFWRKTDPSERNNNATVENRRFRMQARNGFIVNPLADLHGDSRGISEVSTK